MTDLERKEQLIFSSENINNNVAVFGSKAQTGTMEFSNDPNIIQGINNNGINWNNGWSSAVLNGNSPLMEDFNAVSYVNSYNLAYLLQKGIAEWSENTTYFKGNICMVINSKNEPNLYYSYTDNNKGNNPINDTDGNNWRILQFGGSGAPAGTLITSTVPLTDANLHLADGSKIVYNGIYKDFYSFMEKLYDNETIRDNIFCTEEEYNNSISLYGNCGKYVFVKNEYVRLLTINGWIETTTDINNNGVSNEIGLPDHYHTANLQGTYDKTHSLDNIFAGADYGDTRGIGTTSNASSSNSIYGKSN